MIRLIQKGTIKVVSAIRHSDYVWLWLRYIHRWVTICPENGLQAWKSLERSRHTQLATEYHALQDANIMVWTWVLLIYRIDMHIFKRRSLTAVRYRNEVQDPTEIARCSSWTCLRFNGWQWSSPQSCDRRRVPGERGYCTYGMTSVFTRF